MKAVILAGGRGSRLSEETDLKPKPMVEIGGKPILWHLMKHLSVHGVNDFVICLGYLGYVVKEYFANYVLHSSDVTFDLRTGEIETHTSTTEPWRVTLVETGEETMTGGRLKRVLPYVAGEREFLFTYGDGLSDVDLTGLVAFHREQRTLATVTAVQPAGRFGALRLDPDERRVQRFSEKPQGDGSWINGGFFVLDPVVGDRIAGDATLWEQEPVSGLAADGELAAYRHSGFWQPMDTLRDRMNLERQWDEGDAPWRTWGVSAPDPAAWRDRRVLITGHTGFKGAWLALWLDALGARVFGLSDAARRSPSLYEQARVDEVVDHRAVDVRDRAAVAGAVAAVQPEVVLHLAAQPLVRQSFREPVETYAVNVMGTVHVLEAVREANDVRAVVVVTSDKCYANDGVARPFVEDDPLGGHDPYSSSKGCAELVTDAYRRSFFTGPGTANVATGRAGNVIGGGDWGEDRLIPDIVRAALAGEAVQIRRPDAVRPWQHVLNPLSGYLVLAQSLLATDEHARGWNFGPDPSAAQPVSFLVERLAERWPEPIRWDIDAGPHPHEAAFLALDSTAAHTQLGWQPGWDLATGLDATVAWFAALRRGADMRAVTLDQIAAYSAAAR